MPELRALDAKAAAEAIKPLLAKMPSPVSSEEQHKSAFLTDVCKFVGYEPNLVNAAKVQAALTELGIEMHEPDEYPKQLTTKDRLNRVVDQLWPEDHPTRANTPVKFDNAEEETFYKAHPDKALSQEELDSYNPPAAPTPASGAGVVPPVVKPPVPPPPPAPVPH